MKKIFAFSLAEALITLLIVCLITLASIPVLTKKKRDIKTDGPSGLWICTRHSLGHLVHFSSNESDKDINKPDEWPAGCDFLPPLNAKNFNITAIGAGGNGADGISTIEKVADSTKDAIFQPQEDGIYRVVVVGGGGGGGDGRLRDDDATCKKNRCGSGGAGASGAYVMVDVELSKNHSYTLQHGVGGDRSVCDHGSCSRPSYKRGATGGTSALYSTKDNGSSLYIWADGGQGGRRITTAGSGWCTDNCGGGGGGSSEDATYGYKLNSVLQGDSKFIVHGKGIDGESGGCGKYKIAQGGAGLDLLPFYMGSTSLGKGGNGGRPIAKQNGCGTLAHKGTDGRVLIYKVKRLQGYGGSASERVEKMVFYVKGRMAINVGKPIKPTDAEALDENGNFDGSKYRAARTSSVEIFDTVGRKTKSITSYPGDDGENFEGSAPTDGEVSYWDATLLGGAAAVARCDKDGSTPVYVTRPDDSYEIYCKTAKCQLAELRPDYKIGVASNPKEVAELVDLFTWTNANGALNPYLQNSNYLEKMSQSYFLEFFPLSSGVGISYSRISQRYDTYFPEFTEENSELASYYNFPTSRSINGHIYPELDISRCFQDTVNQLKYVGVCTEEVEENHSINNRAPIGYTVNYKCYDGSRPNVGAYGAGGGGGFAYTEPGFASKGGYGGAGAVIIEW